MKEYMVYHPNGQWSLEKGIGDTLRAGVLAGALATSPVQSEEVSKPTHVSIVQSIKDSNPVLWSLAHVESSGGKDLKHRTMSDTMHKKMTAGGPWGIMPHTAEYLLRNRKDLRDRYPDLAVRAKDVDKHHGYFTNAFNTSPQAAYDFAKAYQDRLNYIFDNDPIKVAHAWLNGIRGTKKAIKKGTHDKSFYVGKFNRYYKPTQKKPASK